MAELQAEISSHIRMLTEGSVWIDDQKRTIVVHRVHFSSAVTVGSFSLLIIPDMTIAHRSAASVEERVKSGKMQYCRQCQNI
ncbi:hypothetical protein [Runella salmonicolor]|uniref:Uncharacterized protein n=1 Tax=Runella salmonicolor TaxID=2950278 RepID=A0ABT1FRX9_9BACT|nr:hypothetical protein [Runella salmonicolor]MCP1384472.1 hypothetical protein [Runella salmonicolor]